MLPLWAHPLFDYFCMHRFRSEKHDCSLFTKDDLSLVLLPCFFSHMLCRRKTVLSVVSKADESGFLSTSLTELTVDATTVDIIIYRIFSFLQWVDNYGKGSKHISIDTHHNLPTEIINSYLNDYLLLERRTSEIAINQHLMALNAYYNYLTSIGLTNLKRLYIRPDLKPLARGNVKRRNVVKYLTPELRSLLYRNAGSIRDDLLLRTAGEMGLRAKENLGFLINDFQIADQKYDGLKTLFRKMKVENEKEEFAYYLQGKYSKSKRHSGGESRWVYFHRALLERFEDYYIKERPKCPTNTFFVNTSPTQKGTPISKSRPSKAFKNARDAVMRKQRDGQLPFEGQLLEKNHTHHILRHSFGTDKFYEYAQKNGILFDDVSPTSQPYLTVAALLGHSASHRSAPTTTASYIRSCHIKERFEHGQQ